MGRRNLITVAAFVLLAFGRLAAGTVWDSKPFNAWTDAELNELLTESPWGGDGSMVRIKPDGSTGRVPGTVTVSWTSALPMRQAVARERIGLNGAVTREVQSFLAMPVDSYIVAVKITGSREAQALAAMAGQAQLFTRLEPRDKQPIVALWGEGYVLDDSGNLMAEGGSTVAVATGTQKAAGPGSLLVFAFPRSAISTRDREVKFSSQLGDVLIRRTFHVNEMIYNGKMEL